MKIKTKRLTLSTVDKKMLKGLLKNKQYKEIRCEDWPSEIVKENLIHDLKIFKSEEEFMKWSVWVIIDTLTGCVVGDAGFKGLPDMMGIVDLGYSILPNYRRMGYCFEATSALVSFALAHPLVEGVTADCVKDNVASRRTLEKLEFKLAHENEKRFFYKKN